ncbi:uncharacterized protein CcaverHIS019_0310230 [Cutaneotrichosporon cavernicola]|uniref:Uncharacterized protein n=1 Tax=Cutaneotrichosporon cavernicola TaxID=279322 RepID=A0AA48L2W7_9TREE|nr:uncharacterized protein CcaverHIS019_0310230 [Cutaneotrichosporon cavernicola]BEI90953.1 hypothetical protein CcaverHIS019_0310230 [Cutaneotrichosporon cavernicola]
MRFVYPGHLFWQEDSGPIQLITLAICLTIRAVECSNGGKNITTTTAIAIFLVRARELNFNDGPNRLTGITMTMSQLCSSALGAGCWRTTVTRLSSLPSGVPGFVTIGHSFPLPQDDPNVGNQCVVLRSGDRDEDEQRRIKDMQQEPRYIDNMDSKQCLAYNARESCIQKKAAHEKLASLRAQVGDAEQRYLEHARQISRRSAKKAQEKHSNGDPKAT